MTEDLPSLAYTCPCCGFFSFAESPGSFEICAVCGWEDDLIQLAFPNCKGGANDVRLTEAQKNFAEFGACDRKSALNVVKPDPSRPRNSLWKALAPEDITLDWTSSLHKKIWDEHKDHEPNLYYWEKDYWLNDLALGKKLKVH